MVILGFLPVKGLRVMNDGHFLINQLRSDQVIITGGRVPDQKGALS